MWFNEYQEMADMDDSFQSRSLLVEQVLRLGQCGKLSSAGACKETFGDSNLPVACESE